MSVDRYLEIQGKVVSRQEGIARQYIADHYIIKDGAFVEKKLHDMLTSKKAPLGVVSKDPSEDRQAYLNYLSTNLGFIQESTNCLRDVSMMPTRFNPIQALLMDGEYPFLWMNKCRQFGFSFVLAAKALAKSMLKPKHTSIFVSYNEEESKEKIVYARELYESMPMKWRIARKLKYDNKTSLVFEKTGKDSFETRILSYPQRIIRGKGGEVEIALDEAAHCIHIRKIFTSAMPALSRSTKSSLWIGSSPAGKGGLFHEIGVNQDGEYPDFVRLTVPWWVIPEFCVDIETAMRESWDMHTDERVAKFANNRLKMIRKNTTLDEFRQEYECEYLDEHYSYFPWDLINACVPIFNVDAENTPEFDSPGEDLKQNDRAKSGVGIDFVKVDYPDMDRFEDFLLAVKSGLFKGPFLGGFDVGRTADASEISYVQEDKESHQQIVRCIVTLKNVPLPEQRRIVLKQFEQLGDSLIKFGVDYNGIGRNIAEDLEEKSYDLVSKLDFNSNTWKEEAARRFKMRMSKKAITFPTYKPLLNQIHSIKRMLLPSGAWRFDVEKNSKHHGDKFWSVLAASEVGHPIVEGAANLVSFDKRVIEVKRPKRIPSTQIAMINKDRLSSIMKYNPWGRMFPTMPQLPSLPVPKMPALQSMEGLHELDLTRR
jgi:phage FluMu gp28-like protein